METVRSTLPPCSTVAFLARVRAFFWPTAVYLPSPLDVQYLTNSGLLTTSILALCVVGLTHPKVIVSSRPLSMAIAPCKRMTYPLHDTPVVDCLVSVHTSID